jgi:hypothetical protein
MIALLAQNVPIMNLTLNGIPDGPDHLIYVGDWAVSDENYYILCKCQIKLSPVTQCLMLSDAVQTPTGPFKGLFAVSNYFTIKRLVI